ncbi:MAG: hypothetical protein K6L80_16220 [Agarilytica sp.]
MKTLKYLFVSSVMLIPFIVVAQEESGLNDPMDEMHAQQYDPANDPYEQRRAARANSRYEVYNPGGEWAHRDESSYEGYEEPSDHESSSEYSERYGSDDGYAQDYEESDGAYVEVDEGSADGEEDAYPIRNDPAEYEREYLSETYRESGEGAPSEEDGYESDEYEEDEGEYESLSIIDEESLLPENDQLPQDEHLRTEESENMSFSSSSSSLENVGAPIDENEEASEQALLEELAALERGDSEAQEGKGDSFIGQAADDAQPLDPVEPAFPQPYTAQPPSPTPQ